MSQDVMLSEGSLISLEKAQIDSQVSTAKAFPRDLKRVFNNALSTIQFNKSIAESCIYSVPRAGKTLTGPSIRLAEIMLSNWTNMAVSTRVVGNNGKFISVQAIAIDRENNNIVMETVDRSIMTSAKDGKTSKQYSTDMQQTTAAAGASIALRKAIFRCLGKHFVDLLYNEAKKVAVGDISSVRVKAISSFEKNGIPKDKIFKYFGISSIEQIDESILADMIGIRNSIMEDILQKENAFDPEFDLLESVKEPTKADEVNSMLENDGA